MLGDLLLATDENELRQIITAMIRESTGKRPVKGRDIVWPGAPLSHFPITGGSPAILGKMIAEGTLVRIEKPKSGGRPGVAVYVAEA
jgi:hypothetical protein